MVRNDNYGWVAEKKREAMAAKLARRGMPSYAQRPVSERYGASYTGAGPDGRVDRSAPAGFDTSTDPPHIYHEGEMRVSTPEGVAYLNADIAPAANPGAVREYEAGRDADAAMMGEMAWLGPRKDAKKRFQGTRPQPNSLVDLEGSGEYPGFAAGGAMVNGFSGQGGVSGSVAPPPGRISWGGAVAGQGRLPQAQPPQQQQQQQQQPQGGQFGHINPAAFGNAGAALLAGQGQAPPPAQPMPAGANGYPPAQIVAGQGMPRQVGSFRSGGFAQRASAGVPVVGEDGGQSPQYNAGSVAPSPGGQFGGARSSWDNRLGTSTGAGVGVSSVGGEKKRWGQAFGNSAGATLESSGGAATASGANSYTPAPVAGYNPPTTGQKQVPGSLAKTTQVASTSGVQNYQAASGTTFDDLNTNYSYTGNGQQTYVEESSGDIYYNDGSIYHPNGTWSVRSEDGSGWETKNERPADNRPTDTPNEGSQPGEGNEGPQSGEGGGPGGGGSGAVPPTYTPIGVSGGGDKAVNDKTTLLPTALDAQNKKYTDMANEELDGIFLQNPYTRRQIDDMRAEGASKQSWLAHQQAMQGTDANAAWAQSMMQAAQSEEGISSFAAKAHGEDWNRIMDMAGKWLESGDPGLIAKAAQFYNYMMPGSGIDFAGLITEANAAKYHQFMLDASAMATAGASEEDITNRLVGTGYFTPSQAAAIARQNMMTDAERNVNYLKATPAVWNTIDKFAQDNGLDPDVLAWEIVTGQDLNQDQKIGMGGADGYGEDETTGYNESMGLNSSKAYDLLNTPINDGGPTKDQTLLISHINSEILSGNIDKVLAVVKGTPLWNYLVTGKRLPAENGIGEKSKDGTKNVYPSLDKAKNNKTLVLYNGKYYTVNENTAWDSKHKARKYTLTPIDGGTPIEVS